MNDMNLRPISIEGVPEAIRMAKHYRLLNEPRAAESICRDVIAADPDNHEVLTILLLALTDQFGTGSVVSIHDAQDLLSQIKDEYESTYYAGIIYERWAQAQMNSHVPGYIVYDWFAHAMARYDEAADISPHDNNDAILRYNTCVRIVRRNKDIRSRPEDESITAEHGDGAPLL